MKTFKHIFTVILSLLFVSAIAQVQIDHQLQMTGAGSNAEITGIKTVAYAQDAANDSSVQRDMLKYASATGSGTSGSPYAVTLAPPILTGYTTGMVVYFKAPAACGAGPVLVQVNSLSATTIRKNFNTDLVAGDIANGQLVAIQYDGSAFEMLSQLGNSGSAVPHGRRMFGTTGTYSFTVPTGVTAVWVSMSGGGGGGGGGGYSQINGGGGGGGADAVMADSLGVTSGTAYTITVGSGGSGGGGNTGGSGATGGNNGNPSSFGALLTTNGGGKGTTSSGYGVGGAAGGTGGANGYYPVLHSDAGYTAGGAGGSSIFGAGGGGGDNIDGSDTNIAGSIGGGYGGGGGGGCAVAVSGGGGKGGNGSGGFVLVEW